jgi:competence protein ComEC
MKMLRSNGRALLLSASLFLLAQPAIARAPKPLHIYFIDVEGGQSTLIVSPSGQSLLIDAGWPGERDAGRIVAAAKAAHIKKIDYLLLTHYHRDHAGGVPELAKRIQIGTFVDHGANVESFDDTRQMYAAYEKVAEKGKHAILRPGQGLPIKGLTVEIVAAAGEYLTGPLPGAGEANPWCASEPAAEADTGENAQSLGTIVIFGRFRFLDLGDLQKQKELALACPNNLLGTVDLYLTTHHGRETSNAKAIVWALHPRAAIMNNGARKGGDPPAWQIVHDSPGILDLWQLHYSETGGKEHNSPDDFLANLEDGTDGNGLEVTALPDGTFTVINSRNGFQKTYKK